MIYVENIHKQLWIRASYIEKSFSKARAVDKLIRLIYSVNEIVEIEIILIEIGKQFEVDERKSVLVKNIEGIEKKF